MVNALLPESTEQVNLTFTIFGDFIRWLFKLSPSDKNIPVEVVVRRVRE